MNLSIILPTYNEKENIIETITKIQKEIAKTQDYEILVMDDNSPDLTWKIVNEYYKKNQNIKSIRRMTKRGLSPAIIEGFSKAKGNIFLVMDADGQHDEKIIPKMLENIKNNDIVVGSRFIKGGSVEGWSKFRIFESKFAAMLAKPILSKKIKDPMSGFFMLKKDFFEKVKHNLYGKGYKILLDIVFNSNNSKIKEVPFKFKIRKKGESKLGAKVIIEYLIMLIKYFLRKYCKYSKRKNGITTK